MHIHQRKTALLAIPQPDATSVRHTGKTANQIPLCMITMAKKKFSKMFLSTQFLNELS